MDRDILRNATYHNDKHANKMILEGAQLLCTTIRFWDGIETIVTKPNGKSAMFRLLEGEHLVQQDNRYEIVGGERRVYRTSHENSPHGLWVRESLTHYRYQRDLCLALDDEHLYRHHGDDPSWSHSAARVTRQLGEPRNQPDLGWLRDPPQIMPEALRGPDTVAAYRACYRSEKARMAVWTRRGAPDWY